MSEWDGSTERRVQSSLDVFTTALLEHTADEMDRYKEIIDKIDNNNVASIERHDETHERISHLTQSIEAFIHEQGEFINGMRRAFPKDDEGHPDYDGHRTAHLAWITNAQTSKEFRATLLKNVTTAVVVAVLGFVVVATWLHLLKGPQ